MTVRVVETIAELRAILRSRRALGSIGLVPTMGALHDGHGRLIETARRRDQTVVVSVFVNPTQFNQAQDYEHYPRTLDADIVVCEAAGVDVVFAPSAQEMYRDGFSTTIAVARVSEGLCGRFRPGHFAGVATVVMKLLQIVQPDRAYFGEKDAQQLAVIDRLVRDLNVPTEIVGVSTVREPDGLALSSRNRRLKQDERRAAPVLFEALQAAAAAVRAGETDPIAVTESAERLIAREPLVRLEYLEVVSVADMQPADRIAGPVRIALAAWLGDVRLIDNIFVDATET
jgi:pantoate--beta-alanine ligase